jgi:hypothetical protein
MSAPVHQNDRYSGGSHDVQHVRIGPSARYVVHHRGASLNRSFCNRGAHGVDRHDNTCRGQLTNYRNYPAEFFFDTWSPRSGASRFAPDVNDVGALSPQLQTMGNRIPRLKPAPAIGERIGSDVHHAHDHNVIWLRQIGYVPRG